MKTNDEKELLKKIYKEYFNKKDLEKILKFFSIQYNMVNPEILTINLDSDLEISIIDKESKILRIAFNSHLNDLIYAKISNKNYLDIYQLKNLNTINIKKRIYKNNLKNEKIEKSFSNNDNSFNLPSFNDKNYNRGYFYVFKNDYLNVEIDINLPNKFLYDEELFINEIFNCQVKISDIDILFYIIKKALNCKDATIEIKNENELIYYQNETLMEYIRIKDNQKIEYRNGFKELLITKYEKDSLDNKDFQKILKIVRS